ILGQGMVCRARKDRCVGGLVTMPDGYARVVADGMPNNKGKIAAFRRCEYKCIINLDMLTVGADFPKVDVIALLRKTESKRLMQQILGRGIRLHPDVKDAPTAEERKANIANSPKPACVLRAYTDAN